MERWPDAGNFVNDSVCNSVFLYTNRWLVKLLSFEQLKTVTLKIKTLNNFDEVCRK